ncbi:hypothetical protein D3C86_191880 [compost metagenome]
MTAIVYHDGQLIGDRKQVALVIPTAFEDGPKVFISRDKQFAYGATGSAIDESIRDELELKLRVVLERLVIDKRDVVPLEDILEDKIECFLHGTLMTRDQQFGIMQYGSRFRRLAGHTHGTGTGGTLLASMLKCGMSIKAAMPVVERLDLLTGSKVDVIYASRLKPFVIKGTTL